jgi:chitodextrinase
MIEKARRNSARAASLLRKSIMRAFRTAVFTALVLATAPLWAQTHIGPAYPLKMSSNGRYLVDQDDVPVLIVGDAPHDLINMLSLTDANTYLMNRQNYGINSLWVELVCNSYTNCNSDGTTDDGIAPFTTPGDLSTPNPVYFDKVDAVLDLAAARGMTVFLDPTETGGWMEIFRANGTSKAYEYGQYLGNRYKDFPNIVWLQGNDFLTWQDPEDDALILAIANGIRSADTNHIQTIQLHYNASHSLNDSNWKGIIGLNAVYTYYPTYAEVNLAYNQPDPVPVFLVEANYEFENNMGNDPSTPEVLRRQEYWSILAGALAGHIYGSGWIWRFSTNWQDHLDTPGIAQFEIMKNFFTSYPWYKLVPDQSQTLVTSGFGTYADTGPIHTNDYVTSAITADRTLAMAYLPTVRKVTVDMSQMATSVIARWFDPSDGTFLTLGTFGNTGSQAFTPLGANHDGDGDWVLVLEATDLTPPVITEVRVSSITTSTAVVSWTTNEPADSQVKYGPTSDYDSTTTLDPSLGTSHTVTLTGLSSGTIYQFAVLSQDASGNLATSTNATFITGSPNAPQISGLTASSITATSAVITWSTDLPADSQVLYGATSSYTSISDLNTTLQTSHVVPLTGLTDGTTYHYLVLSKDAANNLASTADATFSTLDGTPPLISGVTATAVTASGATVTWTTDEAADSQVEYGLTTNYGSATALDAALETTHSVSVSGLTGNTAYHYRVKSRDPAGNLTTSGDFTLKTPIAGLVAGYAFAEGAGSLTADASGNGIIGRLINGADWASGKYGNAIQFDGIAGSVSLGNPAPLQLSGSMTISAWINSSAFPIDDAAVVSKKGSGSVGFQLDTTVDQGPRTIGFKLTDGSSQDMIRYGATALQTNVWYHIAGVYDAAAQTMRVYLNSVLDDGVLLGTVASSQQDSAADVLIGRRPGFEFAGTIDEVRIYNRALTQAEIQLDMNTGLGSATDTTPPSISAVTVTNVTGHSAAINWSTNELADSQVEFGTTTAYGSATTVDSSESTAHSVTLIGLTDQTIYHYRVKSKDGSGNLATGSDATFTTLDGTAPNISGVSVTAGASTATIIWTTNEAADSQVEYGLTMAYGSASTLDATLKTSHTVTLSGLAPETTYHYRVKSADSSGNMGAGTDATLTTSGLPPPEIAPMTAATPGLNLAAAPYYGSDFTLIVRGQNFVSGAVVSSAGSALATSFVDSTELRAHVPANVLETPGSHDVKVSNPDGHESNAESLRVIERGDINGNRNVNIGDALVCALTMGGINNPPLSSAVGDLNLNGTTNIGDCLAGALFSGRVNMNFNVPTVTSVSPSVAIPGASLTVNGTGLAADSVPDYTQVLFTTADHDTVRVTPATVSPSSLTVNVPANAVSGPIQVYRLDAPLGGTEFPLQVSGSNPTLALTSVSPFVNVPAGSSITINGMGFDGAPANNTVHFAGAGGPLTGTVTAVDSTLSSLTVTVPEGAICGPVTLDVGGQTSNARMVMVTGPDCTLQLTDIWGGGAPGDTIVLEGAGFDVVTTANNIVRFTAAGGGTVVAPVLAAGGTQLHVRVPPTAVQGNVTVQVGTMTSNALSFVPANP